MKYFELIADKDISNPVEIEAVDRSLFETGSTKEGFEKLPMLTVGYFENSPRVEIYDVLFEPAFLISDRLKRLFALYEPEMEFRGIQLFPRDLEDKMAPLYWLPYVFPWEGLSQKTKKYPNGMLEEMILDGRIPMEHNIFRVSGIFEYKVIVSLPVAESMIRRKISGTSFVPVKFSSEGDRDEEG